MRRLARLWRRSLQTRVVASTAVLSALAIGLTGYALLRDVASSLAENRREVAVAEARAGFEQAQDQLDAAVDTDASPQSAVLTQVVDGLTGSSAAGTGRTYELVLQGPLAADEARVPVRSSSATGDEDLPVGITRSVRSGAGLYWQYADARVGEDAGESPAVVVGRQLRAPGSGDTYAMYYLFSMREQQQTLDLMRNALLLGGLAMVMMVGGVAWLVSRQVLDPVRQARRVAERLASGHLDQRMSVTGEDDIARLSSSFNQMATNLQRQIRRLEDLSRLQQRFVSDVSHELRTPLTTVRMAGEVLFDARDRFDPQTARSAELLQRELDRFEDLLSDLLDLSRFDAGAAQLELGTVDLAEVARACAADPVIRRAGIEVVVHGAERPVEVQADPRRIDRIVRNLLANAAKYSGTDVVDVTVGRTDEAVSFSVRDHGVGLAADENLRMFDRFWRADPARTQGGTGLGLPIAREDAALHGGTLQAWGRRGLGTEVILTIPLDTGRPAAPALVSELAR